MSRSVRGVLERHVFALAYFIRSYVYVVMLRRRLEIDALRDKLGERDVQLAATASATAAVKESADAQLEQSAFLRR